ncbi:MAG: lysophospholipid acyltransferase family protein [Lachnospiraceae bacterium]|nr:lysophospholipid acyltransferase family protein [Lachnospiraceae bacterium]
MIRLILILLVVVLFLVLTIPVQFAEWLIGKKYPHARDISSLRMVQWIFKVVLWLSGTKLTLIGEENVPKDKPVLYVINHRSYFDVLLVYSRVPGLTGFIAKKEIAKVPLLSLWMKRLYCLFLDRNDIKAGLKTILTAIEQVKSGISIAVCPEGTRSKNADEREMLPFKDGAFKIATKTGCPIIPVTINRSSQIMEDHMPWIRSTHVIMEYGTPIDVNALSREDKKFIGNYVQNIMADTLKRNYGK